MERTDLDVHVDGSPMPYNLERLTAAQIEAVRAWIAAGANNDAGFAANVAPIFGTQITLGGASGKCTWCHYAGSPNGLNILAPFDATTGLVNRTSTRYAAKLVAPRRPRQQRADEETDRHRRRPPDAHALPPPDPGPGEPAAALDHRRRTQQLTIR